MALADRVHDDAAPDYMEVERVLAKAAGLLAENRGLSYADAIGQSHGVRRTGTDIRRMMLERGVGLDENSTRDHAVALLPSAIARAHELWEQADARQCADTAEREAARCGTCAQVICPECHNVIPHPS